MTASEAPLSVANEAPEDDPTLAEISRDETSDLDPEPFMPTEWDGPALRAYRERCGVTIEELSSRTKINPAIIRALEDDNFEDTPKARVYVRGFVRCIAEELHLDPNAVARSYVPRWEKWYEKTRYEIF